MAIKPKVNQSQDSSVRPDAVQAPTSQAQFGGGTNVGVPTAPDVTAGPSDATAVDVSAPSAEQFDGSPVLDASPTDTIQGIAADPQSQVVSSPEQQMPPVVQDPTTVQQQAPQQPVAPQQAPTEQTGTQTTEQAAAPDTASSTQQQRIPSQEEQMADLGLPTQKERDEETDRNFQRLEQLATQRPELFESRESFANAFDLDNRNPKERQMLNEFYDAKRREMTNPSTIFNGLMNGQVYSPAMQATPGYEQAQKRYNNVKALMAATPTQITRALETGSILPGTKPMRDLQQMDPQKWAEVQQMQEQNAKIDAINNRASMVAGANDVADENETLETKTLEADEGLDENVSELYEEEEQMENYLKKETSGQDLSTLQGLKDSLNSPEILAARAEYDANKEEQLAIKRSIENIQEDVRADLGSGVPESLIRSIVSQKTRGLQRDLNSINDQVALSQSNWNSLVDDQKDLYEYAQKEKQFEIAQKESEFRRYMSLQEFQLAQDRQAYSQFVDQRDFQFQDKKFSAGNVEILEGPDGTPFVYNKSTNESTRLKIPGTIDVMGVQVPFAAISNQSEDVQKAGLVDFMLENEGLQYEWGGDGENGIDCSGCLVAYGQATGLLPADFDDTAAGMYNNPNTEDKDISTLEQGDLVYYKNTDDGKISHVAIATGPAVDGKMTILDASMGAGQVAERTIDVSDGTTANGAYEVIGASNWLTTGAPTAVNLGGVKPQTLKNNLNSILSEQGGLDKDQLAAIQANFDQGLASNDLGLVKQSFENAAKGGLSTAARNEYDERKTLLAEIVEIEELTKEFIEAGGETGMLVGNIDKMIENFTKTPTAYSKIGVKVANLIDKVARDRTGAAFTPSEEKFYKKLFPGQGVSAELNEIRLSSFKDTLEQSTQGQLKRSIEGAIGKNAYKKLYSSKAEEQQYDTGSVLERMNSYYQ